MAAGPPAAPGGAGRGAAPGSGGGAGSGGGSRSGGAGGSGGGSGSGGARGRASATAAAGAGSGSASAAAAFRRRRVRALPEGAGGARARARAGETKAGAPPAATAPARDRAPGAGCDGGTGGGSRGGGGGRWAGVRPRPPRPPLSAGPAAGAGSTSIGALGQHRRRDGRGSEAQENAVHASLANGIAPASGGTHGREPSWQDGPRARKEHEVAALLDSIRSNRGDPMYSAFAAQMDNLYQVFKELHEQDQLEIRQLLGALEIQRAETQKLAGEASSSRHALQVAERDRDASAAAAATAMAAARAAGAAGPSGRGRVETAGVGVQTDGDGDADAISRVLGRGAGGGGGGSGRPERGRVRLAGGPGGGALDEDGDSSASPPRALQAFGSRRTRMWNTGGGSGSKTSSLVGSPSGRKWSRPSYILFLPYHLHPGHPLWRFYATWLESWSTRRTMWLALAWVLVFLLAVGLLVGLLVPWDNLSKTTMSEPAVANTSSTGTTVTLSLNRVGAVYYVVVPEAATSGGPSAAAPASSSSGRRRRVQESASYMVSGDWWAGHEEDGVVTRGVDDGRWAGAEGRPQGQAGDGALMPQLLGNGGPHRLSRRQLRGQHPHPDQLQTPFVLEQPHLLAALWPHSTGRRRGRGLAESSTLRRLDLQSLEAADVANVADGGDDSPLLPYAVACGVVDISSKNTNYTITLAGRPELLPASLTSTGAAATFAAVYNSSELTALAARLAVAASSAVATQAAECVSNFGLQVNETAALPSWSGARFHKRRCQRCPRLLPGTSYVVLLLGDGGRRTGVKMVRFETSSVVL
ncbi:hypothetical protein HXX76_010991 [Chlamydomonas incerta]|uniref:Uncharacterized protein n=1 Tax=Chlamydomonas incerta TaxID=51695 RepID=A0A835VY14_CHLIN|nr:hypothetical protein HXX76_010991 [Chlamydomonas incerta]|eukprot:KAG2429221.1 hypothetical protein HXX76_010991 [Chlamydomonas incerta]